MKTEWKALSSNDASGSILPRNLPDGVTLLKQGQRLGERISVGLTAFCREMGVRSEAEYRRKKAQNGEITWSMIMGLGSVEEQVEGIKYIHDFGKRTGVVIDRGLVIPTMVTGVPLEVRHRVPKGTSFALVSTEDHIRIAQAAPIQPCFNDWHIGSPAAVANTISAVTAGSTYNGVLAQFMWDLPYCDDDVLNVSENIKAIGIISGKRKDELVVDSYMDDGMPSYFMDYASMIGYARLERYVVDDLCDARYSTGVGGLISHIPTKLAVWLALHDVLNAEHPSISYVYGNTIDPSSDQIASNYGIVSAEMIAMVATERRYRTGASLLPVPVTEKIRVPTREEIAEVHSVARAAASRVSDYDGMLDFAAIENTRSLLVEKGLQFFDNVMKGLEELGVDTKDPLQVLLAMRRLGPIKLESLYHPGERDASLPNGIVPFVRTDLTRKSMAVRDAELDYVRSSDHARLLNGERFLVCSADAHSYGLYVLDGVLRALGATVTNGGVNLDPEDIIALAEQDKCSRIAISTHNGQCLDYANCLVKLLHDKNKRLTVYMGGRLNAVVEAGAEPIDVSNRLLSMGIIPCQNVLDILRHPSKG
jgi:methylmalonyl-CoA mutase cobalamin-binding subunit